MNSSTADLRNVPPYGNPPISVRPSCRSSQVCFQSAINPFPRTISAHALEVA